MEQLLLPRHPAWLRAAQLCPSQLDRRCKLVLDELSMIIMYILLLCWCYAIFIVLHVSVVPLFARLVVCTSGVRFAMFTFNLMFFVPAYYVSCV